MEVRRLRSHVLRVLALTMADAFLPAASSVSEREFETVRRPDGTVATWGRERVSERPAVPPPLPRRSDREAFVLLGVGALFGGGVVALVALFVALAAAF